MGITISRAKKKGSVTHHSRTMHMPPFRAQRFDIFYLFSWSANFCFNFCFEPEECVVVEYISTKNGHFENLQLSE